MTTARKSVKRPKKSGKKAGKSTVVTTAPVKVLQPHGGALNSGGTPGNRGGLGNPPSVLRERLRGSYTERMSFLDKVIDGEVMQKAELPLFLLLPHVVCPNCGEQGMEPKKMAGLLSFEAKVSASVKDRIAALEHQAKYGLGALKEVSVENVRERVAATLGIIRTHCSAEIAQQIVNALRPVWT